MILGIGASKKEKTVSDVLKQYPRYRPVDMRGFRRFEAEYRANHMYHQGKTLKGNIE